VTRLTIPSAVCAVALALLSGCSSDEPAGPGTAAPAASTAPGSAPAVGPTASAPAAATGPDAAVCEKVAAAKAALNDELKRVASPEGKIPPADGKRVMNGLAAALRDIADTGKGEVAKALNALAAEAAKAARAADPVRAAMSTSFDAAGQKVDKACTKG
jgi:hypothetical protein